VTICLEVWLVPLLNCAEKVVIDLLLKEINKSIGEQIATYPYDFLDNSILMKKAFLNESMTAPSVVEVNKVLSAYLEYSNDSFEEITNEIKLNSDLKIKVYEDSDKSYDQDYLLSTSLIRDQVIIPDPLIRFIARSRDVQSDIHNKFLGLEERNHLRELIEICKKLEKLKPFVEAGYVQFLPIFPELTKHSQGTPIHFSETYFEECFKKDMLNWFHSQVKISEMAMVEGKLLVLPSRPKKPCRRIHIGFNGSNNANFYNLMDVKFQDLDEVTRKCTMIQTLPDYPPDKDSFDGWVKQSINQAALRHLNDIEKDVSYANGLNLISSPRNLLHKNIMTKFLGYEKEYGDLYKDAAINLSLPVPQDVNVQHFLNARKNDESFGRFRDFLIDQYKEARGFNTESELNRFLANLHQELDRKYKPEFVRELRGTIFSEAIRWTSFTSAVGVAISNKQGAVGLLALGLAADNIKTTRENIGQMRKMPGYFWSKVTK
jgi:hypothetical protein